MTTPPGLPHFIIAGAAKSATTWLQRSLQQSPAIFMPDHEPHFFARHYDEGMAAYEDLFAAAPAGAMRGEKSNSYLTQPEAAARIARHLPAVRLVFQLRDPVARAWSDYLMLLRRGAVDRDVARHLSPDRAAGDRFLHDGRYGHHLGRFYDLFDPAQILVLKYEELRRDPAGHLARLAAHLGLDGPLAAPLDGRVKDARAASVPRPLRRMLAPLRPILDPLRHTAPLRGLRGLVARPERYPELDPAQRARIADFYRDDTAELARITGLDVSDWTTAAARPHHPARSA